MASGKKKNEYAILGDALGWIISFIITPDGDNLFDGFLGL